LRPSDPGGRFWRTSQRVGHRFRQLMPVHPEWSDVALRLLCAVVAAFGRAMTGRTRPAGGIADDHAGVFGRLCRYDSGQPAVGGGRENPGFVCGPGPYAVAAGYLVGHGFIGAGAIVRRDNLVPGVTTAATVWFVTVIGLCFGGGQIALGLTGVAIGAPTLTRLRHFEQRMKQERQGTLTVSRKSPGLPSRAKGQCRGATSNSF
jgi:putative Mg2+ transporter-C (MgtC) family protein